MTFETLLDAASFLGIATLAVPVWSLNRRKRALAALPRGAVDGSAEGAPGAQAAEQLLAEIRQAATGWVNDWRPIDQTCLFAGYALLLGSSFLRLFV